ncbi:ATP phosphoribosyltransferase regulatory subunit [Actinobaculum suis]|uniref:Histidyl-tRNA synthetase n=1 Tax=Actinobaculum suis TaxID=1657 RepID=A0A7Z9C9S6_9ACTO|nr:ATP phosphoribosyltransferase regulatory subunit [Actinobaculum suis]VDG76699.1 ATP phosphoribosyltransferase regulatory subunit [Actinobaculum suis]
MQALRREQELMAAYAARLEGEGYELMNLNLVEPYHEEDKLYHPSTVVYAQSGRLYSLRSDWTWSLIKYRQRYRMRSSRVGYVGPVVRGTGSYNQAGVELYAPAPEDIYPCLRWHVDFLKEWTGQNLDLVVVNDESLLNLYLESSGLGKETAALVYEKNLSRLAASLGWDHPLTRVLKGKVSEQFAQIRADFPESPALAWLEKLRDALRVDTERVVLDLSFRPPQKYYNGFFFQVIGPQAEVLMSGGSYRDGFGIGISLGALAKAAVLPANSPANTSASTGLHGPARATARATASSAPSTDANTQAQ